MNNKYLKNKIITDYIKYKMENPDYQIPIIKDRPFKAVCKTIKIYIDKIIAYFIGIDYKLIKNSYFIDTELLQKIYKNKIERTIASKKKIIKNAAKLELTTAQIAIAVNLPVKEVERIQKEQKKIKNLL